MENITTKLKTRFLSSSASSDAEALADKQAREDKQSENYKDTETFSYQGVARNILRLVFLSVVALLRPSEAKSEGEAKTGKTQRRSIFVFLFIGVLAVGGYYLFDKPTPEEKAREELAAAMASVGELMILPEGDEPVLATVTDAETLIKQQAFFTGAVNGDQLLLFPRNLKAVLYSPSRKMIVNMGPIQQQPQVAVGNDQIPSAPEGDASRPYGAGKSQTNPNDSEQILLEFNGASQNSNIQNETANSASVPQGSAILTAEIRNGTGKNGLASQIAEQISGNAGYKVLKVTDAHKKDYSETLVVNKNRDVEKLQLVNSLIAALGGRAASELPSGEKDTEADILVILGGN